MSFRFDLRARSRKGRGLFRKAPDPKEVSSRFALLLKRMSFMDTKVRLKNDRVVAEMTVNSIAAPVSIVVGSDAEIAVTGDAWLGPGVVIETIARLSPILDELDFAWTEKTDAPAIQARLCGQLAEHLRGPVPVRVGVPSTRRFRIDAPVLTALGPRDAAWRDAVLADPARGADAFAWWQTGPGHTERARALVAMWQEVAWREPLDDEETQLLKQVDEDLRAARKAKLDIPWDAWKELLGHMGIEDEEVDEHAKGDSPPFGYRRFDLEVELSGGWHVTMPAGMSTHWEDDGVRFWATDGDRAIEFQSLTAEEENDSEKLLAVAPEAHPVIERISGDDRCGRAEAFDDGDVHVVIGLMAIAPHVGILTIKGADDTWALETWRSLRLDLEPR